MRKRKVIRRTIRKIDETGRLNIPKDLRSEMNLEKGDFIDLLLLEDNVLILKKHKLSIYYTQIIKKFLIQFKGMEYIDYYISKQDVEEFENVVKSFIEKKYN